MPADLQNFFAPPRHLVFVILALWLGQILANRSCGKRGVPAGQLENLVMASLLAGILGGRLTYALLHLEAFLADPLGLVSLNLELFSPWGGLACGFLVGWIFSSRKSLPPWDILDSLTPFLAVLAIGVGLSHLASGLAFGAPTSLPWGIEQWGTIRHPSQAYETLAAASVLALFWRQFARTERPGLLFLRFAAWTCGLSLFLAAFRGDSALLQSGLRLEQIAAWAGLVLSMLGIHLRAANKPVEGRGRHDA
ncbi:MAG: hypothetical protein FJZ96_03895 [Chloroflexi bacterium]|nr:hypothetical protein [Chloroflexota bacterium]